MRNLEADASGYSLAKAVYWKLHCEITNLSLEKCILRKDQVPENAVNKREASGKIQSCLSQSSFRVKGSEDKLGLKNKVASLFFH